LLGFFLLGVISHGINIVLFEFDNRTSSERKWTDRGRKGDALPVRGVVHVRHDFIFEGKLQGEKKSRKFLESKKKKKKMEKNRKQPLHPSWHSP
jgi:hypothetical protein